MAGRLLHGTGRARPVGALLAGFLVAALLGPPAVMEAAADVPRRQAAASDDGSIHPGVQVVTEGSQCTANFVFTDRRSRVYLGYSAHCAGLGQAADTDGCSTGSRPLGTPVTFRTGASQLDAGQVVGKGRLAYSSWLTMQRRGMSKGPACAFNDFALVEVAAADRGKVNPIMPVWGGPTELARGADITLGTTVRSYGNSSLRAGLSPLSPKLGVVTGKDPSGWSHDVLTLTPGIPGDSGSGVVDGSGRAFGTLSTLALAPVPGQNGVADLRKQIRFAKRHGGIKGLRLVPGTEPFRGAAGALTAVVGLGDLLAP